VSGHQPPVKVDGDDVYVDPDGDTPKYAHS
jgi:toluene monooxygenase system ferredoxin subunit